MNAILTAYCGEHGKKLKPLSLPGMQHYADKCQVECIAIERDVFSSMLDKMEFTRDALAQYDRVLWLDADTLVRRDMPNLFDIVPETHFASINHCTYCDQRGMYLLHQALVQWCENQKKPIPDTRNRVYCMGIYLTPKELRYLFEPFDYPDGHDWVEQSGINIRLAADHSIPVRVLPWCFSHFVYWPYAEARNPGESSYALHYAGPPSKEQRLQDMARQIEIWQKEGLY